MKRDIIKKEAQEKLTELGIASGTWVWQPELAQLMVVIGGEFRVFKLKSGMSRRDFVYQMGRLAGFAEAAGIKPTARKSNGIHAPATTQPYVQLEIPA